MKKSTFDYPSARNAGYSDEEILSDLSQHHPSFDIKGAKESGYSDSQINQFLSTYKKPKSNLETAGRVSGQYALGIAENALLPYELGAAHLNQPEAQQQAYSQNVMEDVEDFQQAKEMGGFPGRDEPWNEKDQEQLTNSVEQIKNPELQKHFVQTGDIGVRGITEGLTGQDLHPEGFLEKAAGWAGFIKNPKNMTNLIKSNIKPSDLYKAIAPTGKEALRGVGAGASLELAEQGDFGPIGTMAAAVVGDMMGHSVASTVKGVKNLATKPKETFAKIASKFTSAEKKALQKEIIKDFRDAGIQADLGTITDNNAIKWTQARLAQSGLTGKAFDDFKKATTEGIKSEYKKLADALGEARFSSNHEAGEIVKEAMKGIREADLKQVRILYEDANKSLNQKSYVDPHRLSATIEKIEKQLEPGAVKSPQQNTVLETLEKVKRDLYDSSGSLMYANVKDLMNNKIALNDIIDYEIQGGTKQLLKGIVAELDRAIISHGKENPKFAKSYINANKRFSEHAKTFRNKEVDRLLRDGDPSQIMNKMNNVQGIRNVDKILRKTPNGKKIAGELKRLKLDQTIGDHLVDSTTQQAKLGTFSKLLEKGKNREIIKELIGPKTFAKLEKLQKNAGKLAEAAGKFYNSSQSGTVAADAAILAKGIGDIAHVLSGNPWPIIKTVSGLFGARKLSKLLADTEFLSLVEDVILASEKGTEDKLIQAVLSLKPYILQMNSENENSSSSLSE